MRVLTRRLAPLLAGPSLFCSVGCSVLPNGPVFGFTRMDGTHNVVMNQCGLDLVSLELQVEAQVEVADATELPSTRVVATEAIDPMDLTAVPDAEHLVSFEVPTAIVDELESANGARVDSAHIQVHYSLQNKAGSVRGSRMAPPMEWPEFRTVARALSDVETGDRGTAEVAALDRSC